MVDADVLPADGALQPLDERAALRAAARSSTDDERKRDRGAFFGSMHGTLNHLLWGDRMWLGRFTGEPCAVPAFGADMFADFAELAREREATDRKHPRLGGQRDAGMARRRRSSTRAGRRQARASCRARSPSMHLFNHGTHHRGQLTTLMRQAGRDPGVTDLPWLPGVVRIVD